MHNPLPKPTKVTFPKMNLTSEEIALAKKAMNREDAHYLCLDLNELEVREDHPIYKKIESSLGGYSTLHSYVYSEFGIYLFSGLESDLKELRKIWIRCQERDLYTVTLLIGPSGQLKARKYE